MFLHNKMAVTTVLAILVFVSSPAKVNALDYACETFQVIKCNNGSTINCIGDGGLQIDCEPCGGSPCESHLDACGESGFAGYVTGALACAFQKEEGGKEDATPTKAHKTTKVFRNP